MKIKPLSISYGLLRVLSTSKAEVLAFKDIRTAYNDTYGAAIPAVLQGTLTRLRDKGLVETVFGYKDSSNDVTSLLRYKITANGKEALALAMVSVSREFSRMHEESIASGKQIFA